MLLSIDKRLKSSFFSLQEGRSSNRLSKKAGKHFGEEYRREGWLTGTPRPEGLQVTSKNGFWFKMATALCFKASIDFRMAYQQYDRKEDPLRLRTNAALCDGLSYIDAVRRGYHLPVHRAWEVRGNLGHSWVGCRGCLQVAAGPLNRFGRRGIGRWRRRFRWCSA